MSAKQQNSSRIQWATKPLLILLPLMCGTVLIARGRRTQAASSVTVQQDTGQYRSGCLSGPKEGSLNYTGLKGSPKKITFKYKPSGEAKTDTERINEAKQLFEATALYKFVIKPFGTDPTDIFIYKHGLKGQVVFTPSALPEMFDPPWCLHVEFFLQQAEPDRVTFTNKKPGFSSISTRPEGMQLLRDSVFTIEKLKNHLAQNLRSLSTRVCQRSRRCIVTIYTNDNKIYLAESDHFTLITPDGNLSSDKVNEIKDIAYIFAIRLEDAADTPPPGFDVTHAIDIDLE